MGALHSVESPFFTEVFNPEAPIVRALVYYWLCRYEYSRNAVADFMEKYEPERREAWPDFLDRQKTGPRDVLHPVRKPAVSGVSSESLGVSRLGPAKRRRKKTA